jgi:hypothetical protein
MSFFGRTSKYLQKEKPISVIQIRNLVSRFKIRSLDKDEERLVEELLIARRRGDGKISLRQVEDVLRKLRNQNKISRTDEKGLMKVFVEYIKE